MQDDYKQKEPGGKAGLFLSDIGLSKLIKSKANAGVGAPAFCIVVMGIDAQRLYQIICNWVTRAEPRAFYPPGGVFNPHISVLMKLLAGAVSQPFPLRLMHANLPCASKYFGIGWEEEEIKIL